MGTGITGGWPGDDELGSFDLWKSAQSRMRPQEFTKVADKLWVGGEPLGNDLKTLREFGIKNVMSVAKEAHDECIQYSDEFRLVHFGFRDHEPFEPFLLKQALYTLKQLLKRGNTLVHCGVGISRSPSIIALYWYAMGLTPSREAGIEHQRALRPIVRPNRVIDDNVMAVVNALRLKWARKDRKTSKPSTDLVLT